MSPPLAPPRRAALAVLALLAACYGGGGAVHGGMVPIDPNRPGDPLFASGLSHYDAGNTLAAQSRAAAPGPAKDGLAAQAVAEYDLAGADFHQLPLQFPDSIRKDHALYLEGRCDYEVGTLLAVPLEARARFASAWDLLHAALVTYPASWLLNSMAYFAGRALFQEAQIDRTDPAASSAAVDATFALAWEQFDRSVLANGGAPWGDNSTYYRGRCDFEQGYLTVHPLELGATAPAPPSASFTDAVGHFTRAQAELSSVPQTSTYWDNARYYLGRAYFEEPPDNSLPSTTWRPARQADLDQAIAAFGQVLAVNPTIYRDGALYWRGRSHYARSIYPADPVPDLAAASADFHGVLAGTSGYRDGGAYDLAKVYANFATALDPTGFQCKVARAGDPAPASACAAYDWLKALAATPEFAGTPDVPLALAYVNDPNGANCGCTP